MGKEKNLTCFKRASGQCLGERGVVKGEGVPKEGRGWLESKRGKGALWDVTAVSPARIV